MKATAAAAGIAGPSCPVNRVMDTLLMNHIMYVESVNMLPIVKDQFLYTYMCNTVGFLLMSRVFLIVLRPALRNAPTQTYGRLWSTL